VEQRQHDGEPEGARGVARSRAVWLAGAVPAVIYGIALSGASGAVIGVLLWALVCLVAAQVDRYRRRRRAVAAATETTVFDQLRRTPCAMCGSPTLLDLCLDCTEGPSPQRWRAREEPDDPAL
jgi:hypothetical protein